MITHHNTCLWRLQTTIDTPTHILYQREKLRFRDEKKIDSSCSWSDGETPAEIVEWISFDELYVVIVFIIWVIVAILAKKID